MKKQKPRALILASDGIAQVEGENGRNSMKNAFYDISECINGMLLIK